MTGTPAHRATAEQIAPAAMAADMAADMAALAEACNALWLATLSLMTAFMQTGAPAHRLMLARRIARNFATLLDQPCISPESRASFERLQAKWDRKAQLLSRGEEDSATQGAMGWLRKLLLQR